MSKDIRNVINKICTFLNKQLTASTIDQIIEQTKFTNMKKNPMTNYSFSKSVDQSKSPFMRKGEVGDWVNMFTEEQSQFYDQLVLDRLSGTGLLELWD